MKQMTGFKRGGWQTLAVLACVQASACGGVSTDERWEPDALAAPPSELSTGCGAPGSEPTPTGADAGSTDPLCVPPLIAEYGYAEPPSFWLGAQSGGPIGVQGPGFLVAFDPGNEPSFRFSTEADVYVAPDGALEDSAGRQLLGYPFYRPDLSCLGPLRAPATAPPTPTRYVAMNLNLDPRSALVTFDIEDPSNTSNHSASFSLFDSRGVARTIDIYFSHGSELTWAYHVVADGSELAGGVPGTPMEIGQGSLTFTDSDTLASIYEADFCASFAGGADAEQCVSLSTWATSFASFSEVTVLSPDGTAPGTAAFVGIDPSGVATVYFDNGTWDWFGVLALARFPRERALAEQTDGSFVATPASGSEQLDVPGAPGRGVLYYREQEVTPSAAVFP